MERLNGLEVRGLTVRVGGKPLIRNVSLSAQPGKISCLIGPNGAGKSTLIKAIAGILSSCGEILLDGQSLTGLAPRLRALSIGYLPQRSDVSLPFTALEVAAHGLYAKAGEAWISPPGHRESALQVLSLLDMAQFAHRIFNTLSGGEQQLVLLARALIGRPRVLLLDEPASALDMRHRLELDSRLRRLACEDLTILVALHDLSQVLNLADEVILLDRGTIAARGSATELFRSHVFARVFGVELVPEGGPGFRQREALL